MDSQIVEVLLKQPSFKSVVMELCQENVKLEERVKNCELVMEAEEAEGLETELDKIRV